MATFRADVTVSGDPALGTMAVSIVQVPTVPATPPPPALWEPPSWLRTDLSVVAIPATPRPPYNTPTVDPTFKSKITRITGDPGTPIPGISGAAWGDVSRHHYNTDQSWNASQSWLYLDTLNGVGASSLMLDGSTYAPLFIPKNRPYDADCRWHVSDPSQMYFVSGSRLGLWNPQSGVQTLIKDFGSAYSSMRFGPWKGNFTDDGSAVCITCVKGGVGVAFVYNLKTSVKGPDLLFSTLGAGPATVMLSSLGTYLAWSYDPDVTVVTDLAGRVVTRLPSNYVSHADVTVDQAGDEVIVGRVNAGDVGQGPSGIMTKYRLRDGRRTALTTGGWSVHASTRSRRRRWVVCDPNDEHGGYPPYNGEIVMAELDGSRVYRVCHTHNAQSVDYSAEVQASHSPDGGRVIFASAWGGAGSRPVGCYVADFRV